MKPPSKEPRFLREVSPSSYFGLGERRAWREIQNLYMRFVILKVRNPLLCTLSKEPLYVCLDHGIDQPGSINLGKIE